MVFNQEVVMFCTQCGKPVLSRDNYLDLPETSALSENSENI
jgi:hypothetical protein